MAVLEQRMIRNLPMNFASIVGDAINIMYQCYEDDYTNPTVQVVHKKDGEYIYYFLVDKTVQNLSAPEVKTILRNWVAAFLQNRIYSQVATESSIEKLLKQLQLQETIHEFTASDQILYCENGALIGDKKGNTLLFKNYGPDLFPVMAVEELAPNPPLSILDQHGYVSAEKFRRYVEGKEPEFYKLFKILAGNDPFRQFVLRFAIAAVVKPNIYGATNIFLWLWGPPATGKSSWIKMLELLAQGKSCVLETTTRLNAFSNSVLEGKSFLALNEVLRLNEGILTTLKLVTGRDTLTTNRKFQQITDMIFTGLVVCASNLTLGSVLRKAKIGQADTEAICSRAIPLYFGEQRAVGDMIVDLPDMVKKSVTDLFIYGYTLPNSTCNLFTRSGWYEKVSKMVSETKREESDNPMTQFIVDQIVVFPEGRSVPSKVATLRVSDLKERYIQYVTEVYQEEIDKTFDISEEFKIALEQLITKEFLTSIESSKIPFFFTKVEQKIAYDFEGNVLASKTRQWYNLGLRIYGKDDSEASLPQTILEETLPVTIVASVVNDSAELEIEMEKVTKMLNSYELGTPKISDTTLSLPAAEENSV